MSIYRVVESIISSIVFIAVFPLERDAVRNSMV